MPCCFTNRHFSLPGCFGDPAAGVGFLVNAALSCRQSLHTAVATALAISWLASIEGETLRLLSLAQNRIVIFGAVGITCFAAQLALLAILARLGTYRPVANAVSFAVSAQLNFLLSTRLTWRDRPATGRRGRGARWLAYNGTAALSLGCNTAIFTVTYTSIGSGPAAVAGVLAGTCVVYVICNLLVFPAKHLAPGGPVTAGETAVPSGEAVLS
jgi:putative flippase GtrA